MNDSEQINAFYQDLTALILRYHDEFDLPAAATVGVLEFKKHELISLALEQSEDEDDEAGLE